MRISQWGLLLMMSVVWRTSPLVQGFSWGTGCCDPGPSVRGYHLLNSTDRVVVSRTLQEANVHVSIDEFVLQENTLYTLQTAHSHNLRVHMPYSLFKGVFIRIASMDQATDVTGILTSQDAHLRYTETCVDDFAEGLTHVDSSEKDFVFGSIQLDEMPSTDFRFDVTLVGANNEWVSLYAHTTFWIRFGITKEDPITFDDVPVMLPTSSPSESPTKAPTPLQSGWPRGSYVPVAVSVDYQPSDPMPPTPADPYPVTTNAPNAASPPSPEIDSPVPPTSTLAPSPTITNGTTTMPETGNETFLGDGLASDFPSMSPSSAPIDSPSVPPSSSPTEFVCYICGSPNYVVSRPGQYIFVQNLLLERCQTLENQAMNGMFSTELCGIVQAESFDKCGCIEMPPTHSPISSPPSPQADSVNGDDVEAPTPASMSEPTTAPTGTLEANPKDDPPSNNSTGTPTEFPADSLVTSKPTPAPVVISPIEDESFSVRRSALAASWLFVIQLLFL